MVGILLVKMKNTNIIPIMENNNLKHIGTLLVICWEVNILKFQYWKLIGIVLHVAQNSPI